MPPFIDTISQIAADFGLSSPLLSVEPFGRGHINETYLAQFAMNGHLQKSIFQKINRKIFKDPPKLIENVERATSHIRKKLEQSNKSDVNRRVISLLATKDNLHYKIDDDGDFWRAYPFIDNARTFDEVTDSKLAYEAAKAFGTFQTQLSDIPLPPLHETIPDFHNTPQRVKNLMATVSEDKLVRAVSCKEELNFVLKHEACTNRLIDLHSKGLLPIRTVHNDTKINNVLIDDETKEGICVIDLDTVMPGLSLYDFGDLVRTSTCSAAEDEPDLSRVKVNIEYFKALVSGYLSATKDSLCEDEFKNIAFSGKLITLEIGIRFLTDHLQGDTYFKIHRQDHNLDRARMQFKLVQCLDDCSDELERIVEDELAYVH